LKYNRKDGGMVVRTMVQARQLELPEEGSYIPCCIKLKL